ncbi:MAG: hypothetical protein AABX10_03980 [Nanoarchaeota archaeon]
MQKEKTIQVIFLLVALIFISAIVVGFVFKNEITFSPNGKTELNKKNEKFSFDPSSLDQSVQTASAQGLEGNQPESSTLLAPQATHLFDLYTLSADRCGHFSETKVADIDDDGVKDIVAAFYQVNSIFCASPSEIPSIYAWDNQGNLKPGFPLRLTNLNTPYLESYLSLVAIGDVTGDNKLEIVVTAGRNSNPPGGGVYIISSTGQILSHLEPNRGFSGVDKVHVVLADLDNNGKLEIITKGLNGYPTDPDSGRKVFAWYGNGNAYPGWPVVINPPATTAYTIVTEPAVVDFEGNGAKKMIFTTESQVPGGISGDVIALDASGTIQWRTTLGSYFLTNPVVIGDVDRDGEYDIALLAYGATSPPTFKYFILDKNGVIKYQWQINQFLNGADSGIETTLADLNNDNALEIITKDSTYVYVYDYLGNMQPGFPRVIYEGSPTNPTPCNYILPTAPNYCPPGDFGTADLDDDGYLDIYAVALNTYRTGQINDHQYGFFAIDRFGNAVTGYPFSLNNYQSISLLAQTYVINYQPTYADIDDDNIGEILVSKGGGTIEVFSTNSIYKQSVGFCSHASRQYGFDLQNTKVIPKCIQVQPFPSV